MARRRIIKKTPKKAESPQSRKLGRGRIRRDSGSTTDFISLARTLGLLVLICGICGFLFYPDIIKAMGKLRDMGEHTPEDYREPTLGKEMDFSSEQQAEEGMTRDGSSSLSREGDLMENEPPGEPAKPCDSKGKLVRNASIHKRTESFESETSRKREADDRATEIPNKRHGGVTSKKEQHESVSIRHQRGRNIQSDSTRSGGPTSTDGIQRKERNTTETFNASRNTNKKTTSNLSRNPEKEKSEGAKKQLNSKKGTRDKDSSGGDKGNFQTVYQKTFTPKKIFDGGRRIPPVELLPQKKTNSSVRVFLFDDFLSERECDGLMKAHDHHVQVMTNSPLMCFDGITTLRRHLKEIGKNVKVTPNVFTSGTKCLNASFSLEIQTLMKSNWSYSTAFYPGESTFSKVAAIRIQRAMGLNPESGGKFQITSYPTGKAYKTHTDCTLNSSDERDRVVSVLMYLNTVEDGGETKFPELGIWVKPRKGRAIIWNNMSPEGFCETHSQHVASVVKKGSKYILIRWYYYKNFHFLGRRPHPPELPPREENVPMVMCDEYNMGSCRWYDEWSYDPLLAYERQRATGFV